MMQFELPKERPSIIKVIGVGGGGSNAVNHMYNLGIEGVDFLVCNTDQQALEISPVPVKIQLGPSLTEGRGAGAIPEVGKNAAIENIEDLKNILRNNTKMLFITAGMGGGTGTGAAPIIAGVAREMGILTVAIVTIPFAFEGKKRRAQADAGIEELKRNVDTLLVICNDKLREIHGNLKLREAFGHADNVLSVAAKSIAEIITKTLHINVDFADIQTVMKDSGVAIMGSASAQGENRAMEAVRKALDSPLLNDNEIEGARYILLNITSGNSEVSMDEMGEITDYIQEQAGQSAEVIMGVGSDETLEDKINVTIIATGFKTRDQLSTVIVKEEKKVKYDINGELISEPDEPIQNLNTEVPKPAESEEQPVAEMRLIQRDPKPSEPAFPLPVFRKVEEEQTSRFSSMEVINKAEPLPHQETPVSKVDTISEEPVIKHQLEEETVIENMEQEPVITDETDDWTSQEEEVEMQETDAEPQLLVTVKEPEQPEETTFVFEVNTAHVSEDDTPVIPPAPAQAHVEPVYSLPPEENTVKATPTEVDPYAKARERIAKLREMSLRMNTPNGLTDMEKEPAYKRRGVHLDNVPASDKTDVSKFTLSGDSDNRPEIKSNNSFLHDRVD
jgi:cell division protein FtsZ